MYGFRLTFCHGSLSFPASANYHRMELHQENHLRFGIQSSCRQLSQHPFQAQRTLSQSTCRARKSPALLFRFLQMVSVTSPERLALFWRNSSSKSRVCSKAVVGKVPVKSLFWSHNSTRVFVAEVKGESDMTTWVNLACDYSCSLGGVGVLTILKIQPKPKSN